ncbi:MAG: ABC transporter ATP-binding protein [Oscillospiraceae bacterium]|jgi:ABC-2 type transport system ATP-binding protein|nr:ABC transporter ATP-binding protein [Oscillospiraceae bacterium]
MIEVSNLCKSYGGNKAIEDVSFKVSAGEVLGFLGPNGAGKSTTMNIITGYLSSTSGTVKVDGYEILENAKEAKAKIGYLPEVPPLYPDMTVLEYLDYVYCLKKVRLPKKAHLQEVMQLVKIDDVQNRLIKNLSKGYKQRVGFAQALVGNPPVLILDEPTVGLDPKQIIEFRKLIKSLGKKHTVIFSSHVLSEISATCDRIIVIYRGKLVADAKTNELSSVLEGKQRIMVEIDGDKDTALQVLRNIDGVTKASVSRTVSKTAVEYVLESDTEQDIRKNVFAALSKSGLAVLAIYNGQKTLEDAFLKLTAG